MAEFKIYNGLESEIASITSAGAGISVTSEISTDGISSLPTSVEYVAQHKKIMGLLALYKQVIEKDTNDLKALVSAAERLDADISNKLK